MQEEYIVVLGDTLYGIAKKFDTSVQTIKELNNLVNNTISVGQKLIIKPKSDNSSLECIVYTVKKGDNLYNIAKKYNTTVEEIKRYNNLQNNLLNIGDKIVIPCNVVNDYRPGDNNYVSYVVEKGDSLYSIANKFGTTVDKIKNDNDLKTNNLNVGQILIVDDKKNVSSIKECFGDGNYNIDSTSYVVKKGDSLYSIAKMYNVSVQSLKEANNLNSDILNVGDVLSIPNNLITTYTVQKGESLYSIAKKLNVSVESLKKKNNLTSNLIKVGQELII